MTKEITSAANPLIKRLKALATSKKARGESGAFIVEGWRGVKTLMEHPDSRFTIEQVVLSTSWAAGEIPPGTEPVRIPDHLFDKVSEVRNAQGILAVVKESPAPAEVPSSGNFLLLDNLRDPGNLGTLIRSAVGAGFDGVLLYGDCVEPHNPKVVRSTMGTFPFAGLRTVDAAALDEFLAAGFDLCVTTGLGGQNLYKETFGDKTILAIGSEAHGVSAALFEKAAKKLTIPLAPECESLNAATAGSVCMFHIANARRG